MRVRLPPRARPLPFLFFSRPLRLLTIVIGTGHEVAQGFFEDLVFFKVAALFFSGFKTEKGGFPDALQVGLVLSVGVGVQPVGNFFVFLFGDVFEFVHMDK